MSEKPESLSRIGLGCGVYRAASGVNGVLASIVILVAMGLTACSKGDADSPPAPPLSNAAPSSPYLVETSSSAVGTVSVSWMPSSDDTTPAELIRYQVHADTIPGFVATASSLKFEGVGVAATTISTGLTPGLRYYFRILAKDKSNATAISTDLSVMVADTSTTVVAGVRAISLAADQVAAVTSDSVQLKAGASMPAVGQFISSAEGNGFLRAVTGVNGTTLQTRPAALNEVISDVRLASAVAMPAIATASSGQPSGTAGTLTMSATSGGAELHWPTQGLRLSTTRPTPVGGSSQRILSAPPRAPGTATRQATTSGTNIDVSTQLAAGGIGTFTTVLAPSTVGILAGTRGAFDIEARIDRDNVTMFTRNRIPLALCDVRVIDSDLPTQITASSLTATSTETLPDVGNYVAMRSGRATIGVNAGDLPARAEPYRFTLRLYVDEAANRCLNFDGRGLLGWAEKVDVQIQLYVATTPNFPRGESKAMTFSGDFSVTNNTTFTFDPTLETEFDLSLARLRSARVEVKGRAELSQVLTVSASGAGRLDKTVGFIDERRFIKVFVAGPVPVVIVGTFAAAMRLEGEVTGAMTASETLSYSIEDLVAGMRYENGQWVTAGSARPVHTLKVTGEANAQARLTLTLLPRLSVSLYEAATARLVLAPYLEAEAGIRGKVLDQIVSGASLQDADAWVEKAEVAAGIDAYVMADLGAFDRSLFIWPAQANVTDYTTFYKINGILPRTKILGIPELRVTADFNARHPTELYAVLFRGQAVEVPNPFQSLWGPPTFISFRNWLDPRVIAANNTGYRVLDRVSGDAPGDFWVRFSSPGSYIVRLAGHSAMGGWARQIAQIAIELTDRNGNGLPDELEVRDPAVAIRIDSVSCAAPTVGTLMICTVIGRNLPASASFSATNCGPLPMQALDNTSTSRSFTCTPQSAGVSVVVAYTVPGFIGPLPSVPTLPALSALPISDTFGWPVGPSNSSRGHAGTCLDQTGGCYWLSDASKDASVVWRDAQPFQQEVNTTYGWHLGADYNLGSGSADLNQTVVAAGDGAVAAVHENACGFGNMVILRHNTTSGPIVTVYAHVDWLATGKPSPGTRVTRGDAIAKIGSGAWTAPPCGSSGNYSGIEHLHFEVRVGSDTAVGAAYTERKLAAGALGPKGQTDPNAFIRDRLAQSATARLNDTGITTGQCYFTGSNSLVECASASALALSRTQDGMIGRDVTHNDAVDGKAGFSFAQVPKPNGGFYDKTECVRDNVTGLIWEGKTVSGPRGGDRYFIRTRGIFHNGRTPADVYVGEVNSSRLCGFSDWRIPTAHELHSLVDFGNQSTGPKIDNIWFPNTRSEYLAVEYLSELTIWVINFDIGIVQTTWFPSFTPGASLRLVR